MSKERTSKLQRRIIAEIKRSDRNGTRLVPQNRVQRNVFTKHYRPAGLRGDMGAASKTRWWGKDRWTLTYRYQMFGDSFYRSLRNLEAKGLLEIHSEIPSRKGHRWLLLSGRRAS